jgi:hypothetical protein
MMNMKRKILVQVLLVTTVLGVFNSCKESFLEVNPQGPLASENLANKPGVEAALIGAYAMLTRLTGYWVALPPTTRIKDQSRVIWLKPRKLSCTSGVQVISF